MNATQRPQRNTGMDEWTDFGRRALSLPFASDELDGYTVKMVRPTLVPHFVRLGRRSVRVWHEHSRSM